MPPESILNEEIDARGLADSGNRRGQKSERLRVGQSRELSIDRRDDRSGLQGRGAPLLIGREQAEVETAAGARTLREDAVAGDRIVVAHAGLVFEDLVDLAHHEVGALERRGFRQFDVHQEVALVFVGQKRRRQDLSDSARQHRESDQDNEREHEPSDEQSGNTDVAFLHAREARVESREEARKRAA